MLQSKGFITIKQFLPREADEEAGVGAEEEGARRAVVVPREADDRSVLLPQLQRPDGGGGVGYWLRRRLAGLGFQRIWGFAAV